MEMTLKSKLTLLSSTILAFSVMAPIAYSQDFGGVEGAADNFKKRGYSPYADRSFPTQVLWGDSHLHTALSFDAGAFGNRLQPDDAYKFAKGGQVTSSTGVAAKLSRPLDWLVVADHSDNMGLFTRIFDGHPDILSDPEGKRIYGRSLSKPLRMPMNQVFLLRLLAMNGHRW